jgi:sulfate/thiosulfate transport system substrate-binding protein
MLSSPRKLKLLVLAAALVGSLAGCSSEGGSSPQPVGAASSGEGKTAELLNVSYDPTRELWKELNAAFIPAYEKETGVKLTINPSHGSSGTQALAIINGQPADVATLSLWPDTHQLQKEGLLKEGWEERLPNHSMAYTSTVILLVRAGNPKGIKDWANLIKPGVVIVTPNPKTSGNGRLSFLAAWGSVTLNGGSEEDAKKFITELYKNVSNLDTGARASTATFGIKGIGDVHITMESEAYLAMKESPGKFEIINPSISILHEPPLAVIDKVVDEKGTRAHAEAYLKFLYTPEGQEIIAKNFYRPTDPEILAKHKSEFADIKLFPITAVAKDWSDAQAKFFADDGVFDTIYQPAK